MGIETQDIQHYTEELFRLTIDVEERSENAHFITYSRILYLCA